MKKRILITGASTGIGYDAATTLQKKGFHIYAGVRKDADFVKLNEAGCQAIYLDVTKDDHVDNAFQMISPSGLDILINNAGIAVAGPIEGVPVEDMYRQMEVNFFSIYKITQKFLPLLRSSKGRVINISSIAGRVAAPLLGPYAISKFALEALSDALRREMIEFNVHVSLIEPGAVQTPIWEKSKQANEVLLDKVSPELQKVYSSQIQTLRKVADHAQKNAVPVKEVTKAILHSVTANNPKTRYLVGKEARIANFMSQALPDKIFDKLVKVV